MMVRLGDICSINMGQSPDSSLYNTNKNGLPFFQGNSDFGDINPVARVWCSKPIKTAKTDDILISVRAPIGSLNIADGDCCIGRGLAALTVNESMCIQRYLWYVLLGKVDELNSKGTGSTFKAISKKVLEDTKIFLPSLAEQRKIAVELDQISALINKRRQQLEKLDLLVKAKFVEMFGDPVTNPKKWSITKVGEVIESIDSGWSGNGTQRERKEGEIAVLKVSAVTKGYFIPSECKVLDDQKQVKKFIFPQKGDLLFSRANTREMVGATAIVREDYPDLILPDKLWKIRFMDMANVIYMKYILSSQHIRSQFSAISTGTSGSMYNVSMEKFRNVQIPMPEIEIQNQFSVFYEQTEKTRNTISRSLEKLETLKKAQMQKYFG